MVKKRLFRTTVKGGFQISQVSLLLGAFGADKADTFNFVALPKTSSLFGAKA